MTSEIIQDLVNHFQAEHDISIPFADLESLVGRSKDYTKLLLFIRVNMIQKKRAQKLMEKEKRMKESQKLDQLRSESEKLQIALDKRLKSECTKLQLLNHGYGTLDKLRNRKNLLSCLLDCLQKVHQLDVQAIEWSSFLERIENAISAISFDFKNEDIADLQSFDPYAKTTTIEMDIEKIVKKINHTLYLIKLNCANSFEEVQLDEQLAEQLINTTVRSNHHEIQCDEQADENLLHKLRQMKQFLDLYKERRLHLEKSVEPKFEKLISALDVLNIN